jgi:phosphatidylserine/phosphatidylglycerophosphate/cardiolipin synthase-like enzyme
MVTAPWAPAIDHARARTSSGVLAQLIAQAERYLVIAAPFIQSGEVIEAGPLADVLRAALQRGVNVDIVSTGGGLRVVAAERLRRTGRGQVRLFQPHCPPQILRTTR